MNRTKELVGLPTAEIGKWYIDGFCTNHIITPVKDDKYIRGIYWKTVRRCGSNGEANKLVKEHSKENDN